MSHHSPNYSEDHNPWRTKKASVVYDNPWIRVAHEEVIGPNGQPGIYGRVHFKNTAVGIVAIDSNEHIYLVGQYRYPLDKYSWEIPEGGCPKDEDPLDAAKRELQEETGLVAESWEKLAQLTTSNCISDERAILYVARNLTQGPNDPDETELLDQKRVPFEKAVDMVLKGRITDGLSVAGILHCHFKFTYSSARNG